MGGRGRPPVPAKYPVSGQIALAITTDGRVVQAGLLAIGARIRGIGFDAEIVVLAEISKRTGTRAGTALRTDGGRLLAAGIVEIAVKPGL